MKTQTQNLPFYLILTGIFLLGIPQGFSQISFTEVSPSPFEAVFESSIAFADVDGDGDQDLLISGRSSGSAHISRLYLNDGNGVFTLDVNAGLTGASNSSVGFADIDRDQDLDLLISGQASGSPLTLASRLYQNDGSGGFTRVTGTPFAPVQNASIAFADVDGNATPDLVITGDGGGSNYIADLYVCDSAGGFSTALNPFGAGVRYSEIAFADVDGDLDQDLLITGIAFQNPSSTYIAKLFINDGKGGFTEKSGTPFPGVAYSSVAFADVDGDRDQDVFIAGGTSGSGKSAALYLNDGNGGFSLSSQNFTEVSKASVAFADVDRDADPDLLLTGESGPQGRIAKLYENDGMGNFTEVSGLPLAGVGNGSVAFADVNRDSFPDLVITGEYAGGSYISALYLNDTRPSGLESELTQTWRIYPNPTQSLVFVDVPLLNPGAPIQLSLYDISGRVVKSMPQREIHAAYDITDLNPGMYRLVLRSESGAFGSKALVKY